MSASRRTSDGYRARGGWLLSAVGAPWVVWWLDIEWFGGALRAHGVRPRDTSAIDGVLWAPFLHIDSLHLLANTVPHFVLGGLVCLRGPWQYLGVLAASALLGGAGVWWIGEPGTVHVGSSGVVFGLFGFILCRGLLERTPAALGTAALVGAVYGGLLWAVVPGDPSVSWEGHACGLSAGLLWAWLLGDVHGRDSVEG